MLLIGDVHGKYEQYKRLIKGAPPTIQVGDMGVGFRYIGGPRDGEFRQNPPHRQMKEGGHRFIRGNHDNPDQCRRHSQFILDGTVEDGVMFVGGAQSIDRAWRLENYDWWEEEELSSTQLFNLTDAYIGMRPRAMITHDCPDEVAEAMEAHSGRKKLDFKSRTRQALQSMWSAHSPKVWVYGHWHYSFDQVLRGTRFICLAELEMKEIEI